MDCSTLGFPVLCYLLEFAQTHVHWVGDAIQPSHPLLSPSLPAFNLSQHQGLFQWVDSSHQVAEVLEFQLQHQSFQWTFSVDLLWDGLVWSPYFPRDSQESSPAPQFHSINLSVFSLLSGPILYCWVWTRYKFLLIRTTWCHVPTDQGPHQGPQNVSFWVEGSSQGPPGRPHRRAQWPLALVRRLMRLLHMKSLYVHT